MNITSQSDYNQNRINLMFAILKARQDSDFARADHLTRLLREEMEKHEQGGKAGLDTLEKRRNRPSLVSDLIHLYIIIKSKHNLSISGEMKSISTVAPLFRVSATMDLMIKPLAPRRNVSKSKHRKQQKLKKRRERRETMERLKSDMVEIGEGQKRIREGQREIRQKFEEIESECRSLREETMSIAGQSDYNQNRINLMFDILKARQDSDFARADHLTRLLREEMEKHEQGGKAGLVG
uniref:Uncharacterized protein n=1 Tax=Salix viminalis TaxID=40686 RepID=A0A6N2KNL8_SALVM